MSKTKQVVLVLVIAFAVILLAFGVAAAAIGRIRYTDERSPTYTVDSYAALADALDGHCALPDEDLLGVRATYTVHQRSHLSRAPAGYSIELYLDDGEYYDYSIFAYSLAETPTPDYMLECTTETYREVGIEADSYAIQFIINGYGYFITARLDIDLATDLRAITLTRSIIDNHLGGPQSIDDRTGEQIVEDFVLGRLDAEPIFARSDMTYVADLLAKLEGYYTAGDYANYFSTPAMEPLPDNGRMTTPLTLEHARVIGLPSSLECPILLQFAQENYTMYVGLTLWDWAIETPADLATAQWRPVKAYFIPERDAVRAPDAVFDDIKVYYTLQGNAYTGFKLINTRTGYSVYAPELTVSGIATTHIAEPPIPTLRFNYDERILLECDGHGFVVFDLAGSVYRNSDYTYARPYLAYEPSKDGQYIPGTAEWSLPAVTAEHEGGKFSFHICSYVKLQKTADGFTTVECTSPVVAWQAVD